jgi:2-(1,2-epoxy-1,2-dihydrophenyl)acetyl-CoA isomerase
MTDDLLVSTADHVTTVTLNRPEALNALTPRMISGLLDLLRGLDADPDTRVVVITGAGRGFCAGADLGALASELTDGQPGPGAIRELLQRDGMPLARALLQVEKPLVAAVNGPCAGAGLSLALACDFAVASTAATFTLAFIRRGLVPDYGATWLLPRLVGLRRARELCLLGDRLDAAEAAEAGLVGRVVAPEDLAGQAEALARRLASGAGVALRLTKRLLNDAFEVDHPTAVDREFLAQALCFSTNDAAEGMAAFLGKREPSFTWS